jgi:hypothetical protein
MFDVIGGVAQGVACLFSGDGGKEHSNTDADGYPDEKRRSMRPAAVRAQGGSEMFSADFGGIVTITQHACDGGPDGSVCGEKAKLESESEPILFCWAPSECTHFGILCAEALSNSYSEAESVWLSVSSGIEDEKGLYGVRAERRLLDGGGNNSVVFSRM